jgi:hypothetical protein
MSVLDSDYEIQCFPDEMTSLWWILAACSALGLVTISLGLPFGMYVVMTRDMRRKLQQVRQRKLSLSDAYRQHGKRFAYMSAEFKPTACERLQNIPPLSNSEPLHVHCH